MLMLGQLAEKLVDCRQVDSRRGDAGGVKSLVDRVRITHFGIKLPVAQWWMKAEAAL
jgi:hypothetical protein